MATIKRQKLAESVIGEIKRMINSGELKEGDKLPNQNEFAAQLGVSRPSLREALHTLSLIGAIEQRPGLGTVIKAANPALWAEHLSPPLVSDVQASLELIEARRFIEAGVTELAVKNATAKDIQKMGKLVAEMRQALNELQPRRYSELDMEFHHQIAQASHNRYMVHMFVTIRGLLEQFIREGFALAPGLMDRSFKYHQKIYQGIREKDVRRAVTHMKNHINDIRKTLSKHYESQHA